MGICDLVELEHSWNMTDKKPKYGIQSSESLVQQNDNAAQFWLCASCGRCSHSVTLSWSCHIWVGLCAFVLSQTGSNSTHSAQRWHFAVPTYQPTQDSKPEDPPGQPYEAGKGRIDFAHMLSLQISAEFFCSPFHPHAIYWLACQHAIRSGFLLQSKITQNLCLLTYAFIYGYGGDPDCVHHYRITLNKACQLRR